MTVNRERLLAQATDLVQGMLEKVEQAKPVALADLPGDRTALVIVDMINGFAYEGALSSPRVAGLVPEIARLQAEAVDRGLPVIAFGDAHPADSVEFIDFPAHCIAGTRESDMVKELAAIGGYTLIEKNSTNGYLEPAFQEWLAANPQIDTFVVAGDCTDICVLHFALTIKGHFTRQNRTSRVIVPANGVDTFDAPHHNGDFQHILALHVMMGGGIEVVSKVN